MVPVTQPVLNAKEKYLQAVEEEFAKFERREAEFTAQDRRQRAAQLRLPIFGLRRANRLSQRNDTVA
jgi:hypothetical protein